MWLLASIGDDCVIRPARMVHFVRENYRRQRRVARKSQPLCQRPGVKACIQMDSTTEVPSAIANRG